MSNDLDLDDDRVLVKPSIRAQSALAHGTIGKSVNLRCSATGPHDTTLYWRRLDHNDFSSQSTRFRQQQQIHGDTIQTTLHIKELEKTDFGQYACLAESQAGRSETILELKGSKFSSTYFNIHISIL